jgi:hypothetical protein
MFTRISQLRLLSVLLTLVLVAPPLGGRLSDRPAAQAANRPTSPTTNQLLGVACPRPSTCVAVGYGSTILRSADGGSTWSSLSFGTALAIATLNDVACPRPSTCLAVGLYGNFAAGRVVGGTILRSTDGGSTWRSV